MMRWALRQSPRSMKPTAPGAATLGGTRPGDELLAAHKLPLEERLNRPERRCATFFIPASFTKSAHMRRKPHGMPHHSEQKVSGRENEDQKNSEQVERYLRAPRMHYE